MQQCRNRDYENYRAAGHLTRIYVGILILRTKIWLSGQHIHYICHDIMHVMACNTDFVHYIADQRCDAGTIMVKNMFGDYGLYCDGIIVEAVCDNSLFLKLTKAGKALLREVVLRPPNDGAKDFFYIADVDDREYLAELVKATLKEL